MPTRIAPGGADLDRLGPGGLERAGPVVRRVGARVVIRGRARERRSHACRWACRQPTGRSRRKRSTFRRWTSHEPAGRGSRPGCADRDAARPVPERSPRLARDDRRFRGDAGDPPHGAHQAVPRGPCRRPGLPRHPPRRVLLDARAERLRQDDDPADDRRLRAPDRGPDRAPRPGRHDGPAGQAAGQHGLPELRAVPPSRRRGQRRVRPPPEGRREGRDEAVGSARPWTSSTWPATSGASRTSCPAASSSASPSPGR